MSTPTERLLLVHDAFSKAYARRAGDLKQATSNAQADRILRNVDSLETSYLKAAKQALDATGGEVEAAFRDAKAAQQAIDDAYQEAKALAERIRLVGSIAQSIGNLVRKAATV